MHRSDAKIWSTRLRLPSGTLSGESILGCPDGREDGAASDVAQGTADSTSGAWFGRRLHGSLPAC